MTPHNAAAQAATAPLPQGFRITVDPNTKQLDAQTLFGGSPARVLRLTPPGARAWQQLQNGEVCSPATGVLARRLVDAGLAHPCPPPLTQPVDVMVVIPARDRAASLDRCLAALGTTHPVVVVDDGSHDQHAVAATAARHGARLLRRADNGGPGQARNSGLAAVSSEYVAFLDSDTVPVADWIDRLSAHFADPLVGAVAARIVPHTTGAAAERYAAAFGSLDLGARQASVAPNSRVPYVPTAALVARRAALDSIVADGLVFDPALRVGEDVDLVWRLHRAGWRIRFDPSVHVAHQEPADWPSMLVRRFRYGTSAAPLATRHPANMHPLVLHPGPTLTVAALAARRPLLALASYAAYLATLTATLRKAKVPAHGAARATAAAVGQTGLGIGRYLTQFATPVLVLAIASATRRRRWRRVATLAAILASPALTSAQVRGIPLPTRILARCADDAAYGAGVWVGCIRQRTVRPLRPAIAWPTLHISTPVPDRKAPPPS